MKSRKRKGGGGAYHSDYGGDGRAKGKKGMWEGKREYII